MSDPANPALSGSLGIGGGPSSLAIYEQYVLIVHVATNDLKVIDVSDPANPALYGSLAIGGYPYYVDVSGHYAFVVDLDSDDLKVIDVSDPANPALISSLMLGESPVSVAASTEYAYVVDVDSEDLKVIDIRGCKPTLSMDPASGEIIKGPQVSWDNHGEDIYNLNLGYVGIGNPNPVNLLDIMQSERSGIHASDRALYVSGDIGAETNGFEFMHSNATQGMGIGYRSLYAAGNNANQNISIIPKGAGNLLLVPGGAGKVGIGTNTPQADLHISGGSGSVHMLLEADTDNNNENDQPLFTFSQDGGLVKAHLGFYNGENDFSIRQIYASGISFHTNNTIRMTIDQSGHVGIGNTTPVTKLHVSDTTQAGNFAATIENDPLAPGYNNGLLIRAGQNSVVPGSYPRFVEFRRRDGSTIGFIYQNTNSSVAYSTSSDIRLKEQICASKYGLADLLKIDVRDYRYKNDETSPPQTGFIAQQLYEVYPQAVQEGGEDPKTEPWQVSYGSLTPLLVKAIQELAGQNEALEAQVGGQQEIIDKQQEQIQWLMNQFEKMNQ